MVARFQACAKHSYRRLAVAALALFVPLAVAQTNNTGSASSKPPIDWASQTLFVQAPIGGSISVNVSGTIQSAIPATNVSVTPSLSAFVHVTPPTVASLPVGAHIQLTLTVSIPSGSLPGIFDGTIQLRSGKQTIARPLPVTVCAFIPKDLMLEARGLSLLYPSSWYLDNNILGLGGPIAIDNHAGQNAEGGFAPPEGADIRITSGALPQISIAQLIAKELAGTTIQDTTSISVGGEPGTRVAYSYDLPPTLTAKAVAVYVPHDTQLYKFVLTYNANAQGEANFLSTFSTVLNSVQFQP